MIATLLILQSITASAIAAPLPPERASFAAVPSAAARALTVERVAALPATPVTFTFQCLAFANGTIWDCSEAADGGTRDLKTFYTRAAKLRQDAAGNPLLAAAQARTGFYRLRAIMDYSRRAMRARRGDTRSVLIQIPVSAADRPAGGVVATVDKTELRLDPASLDLAHYYPAAALRAGVGRRVSATCRVLNDRSLWCRDARVELAPGTAADSPGREPQLDDAFTRATVRALASATALPTLAGGGSSIGRETRLTLAWLLP